MTEVCYHCKQRKPYHHLADTYLRGLCKYCLDNLLDSYAKNCRLYKRQTRYTTGCQGECYFFKDEPTDPPHCYEPISGCGVK